MAHIFLEYGDYRHAIGDAAVSINRVGEFNDLGVCYAIRETWSIQGRLIASSQNGVSTAISRLESAYYVGNRPIGLYFGHESGGKVIKDGATQHSIVPGRTIDGVRVRVQPSYQLNTGGEYTTYRHYNIAVEALVKTGLYGSDIAAWDESVTSQGGQPRDIVIETLNTAPVIQRTAAQTAFYVTQTGRAVGLNTWPAASPWIFSLNEAAVYTNRIGRRAPRTTLLGGLPMRRWFETTWEYVFGLATAVEVQPLPRPI
jgi:hypothetical protein